MLHRSSVWRVLVLIAVLPLLASTEVPPGKCKPWPQCKNSPSPSPSPSPAPTLILKGIFTRGGIAPAGAPVSGSTIQVRWASVQATKGGPFDWSSLDQAIATSWARGFPVRLRPMLGAAAPLWAKNIGAGPLQFYQVIEQTYTPIPALWDPVYQSYAEKFVRALAAHIAGDTRVRLVFASAAMAVYAEPLVRGVARNCPEMFRGGYTRAGEMALQRWQLDIMSGFTQPIGMAYNPHSVCLDADTMTHNAADAAAIMDHQLSLYGPNTVLQNNELGRTPYRQVEQEVMDAMKARNDRAFINFQCAAPARLTQGEYAAIVDGHDTYGASGVEWSQTLSDAEYAELDALLKS